MIIRILWGFCYVVMLYPLVYEVSDISIGEINAPLIIALLDRNYGFAVVLSIGACLPNFIDIIYESYRHIANGVKLHKKIMNQIYFTICFFIPNMIIYFNIIPTIYFEYLPILYSLKIISIYSVLILNILDYGKNVFHKIYFFLAFLMFISCELLILTSTYSESNIYISIFILTYVKLSFYSFLYLLDFIGINI